VQSFAKNRAIHTLPNGLDVEFWRAAEPIARNAGPVRLVSVMRLNSKKRPLALVGMMRQLRALDSHVELRIVGDGPLRTELERAIRRAGLTERIQLLGHQSREQIRSLFASSDIFVLPTVRESFGLAALEARCAGLPVVAMRASGVTEFIAHGVNGLLAESDRELTFHVAELAANRFLLDIMAAENRRSAPPFDWSRVLETHVALYEKAIALRRPTGANL
jgi:glycosyltransferase involved in cell wall biosynthesis